ncbi:MAG: hypothetical protein ABIH87_01920 [bacterium]
MQIQWHLEQARGVYSQIKSWYWQRGYDNRLQFKDRDAMLVKLRYHISRLNIKPYRRHYLHLWKEAEIMQNCSGHDWYDLWDMADRGFQSAGLMLARKRLELAKMHLRLAGLGSAVYVALLPTCFFLSLVHMYGTG